MRRIFVVCAMLALTSIACALGSAPATPLPPTLAAPQIGLSPVTASVGTLVTVSAAGFPPAAKVNLLVTVERGQPVTLARELPIGADGRLTFSISIPPVIGTTTIAGTMQINFVLQTTDGAQQANAIFVAVGSALTTVTAARPIVNTPSSGIDTSGYSAIISAPSINSAQTGASITVSGRGSDPDNNVVIQVTDASYKLLGSATGKIQASTGVTGSFTVAVPVAQPATQTTGYIIVLTSNTLGGAPVARASIPVLLGPTGTGVSAVTITPPARTATPGVVILTNTPRLATPTSAVGDGLFPATTQP